MIFQANRIDIEKNPISFLNLLFFDKELIGNYMKRDFKHESESTCKKWFWYEDDFNEYLTVRSFDAAVTDLIPTTDSGKTENIPET